ncbi:MAG TPA: class I SAM-dependent methyltransferase, partial [Chthoniobacterales bacterium]
MNALDYVEIAERPLEISTPTSRRALLQLAATCRVKDGTDVLDIGSGHGLLLRLWARHWAVRGTGVDRSADAVGQARRKAEAERVSDRVRFVVGEAADLPMRPEGHDVVTCVGASFALGGFAPAVAWMAGRVRPGGILAVGELFLVHPVSAETLRREQAADLRTREQLLDALAEQNVRLLGVMPASTREWDRYCVSSWRAVAAWARANPLHPDRTRLEHEADTWRRRYRRFARSSVGWAFFVAERSCVR